MPDLARHSDESICDLLSFCEEDRERSVEGRSEGKGRRNEAQLSGLHRLFEFLAVS